MREALETSAALGERVMNALEVVAAFILTVLFALGVVDLGLSTVRLMTTGRFNRPEAIIHLIETALLLFLVVEIFHTVVAYAQDRKVTRIVIDTGLIAGYFVVRYMDLKAGAPE